MDIPRLPVNNEESAVKIDKSEVLARRFRESFHSLHVELVLFAPFLFTKSQTI